MKSLLAIFIFTFSSNVFSVSAECSIELPVHIYKINNNLEKNTFIQSDCDQNTQEEVLTILERFEGEVSPQYLSIIASKKTNKNISFNRPINLHSLKTIIRKKLNLKDTHFYELKSARTSNLKSIANNSDVIEVKCDNCNTNGVKNIQIKFDESSHWFIADLRSEEVVYTLKTDITPHTTSPSQEILNKETVLRQDSTPLFSDIENIKYYQFIRPLKKGSVLTQRDLRPKILVRAFKDVAIELKGKNIYIKGNARAVENGHLGDIIKLINTKTQKTIKAKVVDYNKVTLEL